MIFQSSITPSKRSQEKCRPGFVVLFFLMFFAPLPKQKIIFMALWRVTDLEISDFILFHFIA